VHPSVQGTVDLAKSVFGTDSVAILSNSVGTADDVDHAMARATELAMKIPVIRHQHKKPACLDEVRAFLS
jgi:phosphatidylglycerophosphatase GEP4